MQSPVGLSLSLKEIKIISDWFIFLIISAPTAPSDGWALCDFASFCVYIYHLYFIYFYEAKWRVITFWGFFHQGLIFLHSRVAVIRGQVLSPQGLGIIGVRVSVDSKTKNGFTLTRPGGWWVFFIYNAHLNWLRCSFSFQVEYLYENPPLFFP